MMNCHLVSDIKLKIINTYSIDISFKIEAIYYIITIDRYLLVIMTHIRKAFHEIIAKTTSYAWQRRQIPGGKIILLLYALLCL